MNALYIICGIITLVLYILGELQDWRKGENVTITRGDVAVVGVMALCGYYGLAMAIVIIAENNWEWLAKAFLTFRQKNDEEVEGDDKEGE